MIRRVALTGATGFIGRHVSAHLVARGIDVIAAEVRYEASAHTFTLALMNVTQQVPFAVARPFPARRTSAEWIAEAPANPCCPSIAR